MVLQCCPLKVTQRLPHPPKDTHTPLSALFTGPLYCFGTPLHPPRHCLPFSLALYIASVLPYTPHAVPHKSRMPQGVGSRKVNALPVHDAPVGRPVPALFRDFDMRNAVAPPSLLFDSGPLPVEWLDGIVVR